MTAVTKEEFAARLAEMQSVIDSYASSVEVRFVKHEEKIDLQYTELQGQFTRVNDLTNDVMGAIGTIEKEITRINRDVAAIKSADKGKRRNPR